MTMIRKWRVLIWLSVVGGFALGCESDDEGGIEARITNQLTVDGAPCEIRIETVNNNTSLSGTVLSNGASSEWIEVGRYAKSATFGIFIVGFTYRKSGEPAWSETVQFEATELSGKAVQEPSRSDIVIDTLP